MLPLSLAALWLGLLLVQDVVAELIKEANVLSGLRHPNIVWVYGLVMPSLTNSPTGAAPSDILVEGSMSEVDAVSVATQAANR